MSYHINNPNLDYLYQHDTQQTVLTTPIKEFHNFNLLLLTIFIHSCDLNSLVLIQDHILNNEYGIFSDIYKIIQTII